MKSFVQLGKNIFLYIFFYNKFFSKIMGLFHETFFQNFIFYRYSSSNNLFDNFKKFNVIMVNITRGLED